MMKKSALGGLFLAIAGIAVGLFLDGGKPSQLIQPTAALIVFGGTLGAVLIQFPFEVLAQALAALKTVFWGEDDNGAQLLNDIIRYAAKARRSGVVSLDSELESIEDPFLKKCLTLAVDGTLAPQIRETMDVALNMKADEEDAVPRVFEAAGGFAPTIGILGAVIGLIQVMQHLDNISAVGRGIAGAFVATIYGVGAANLFLLPCAGRIKRAFQLRQAQREMVLEGVVQIVERSSPGTVEAKLSTYLQQPARPRPVVVAAR